MYERYYGFTEKPFSLTPDPKYLYRSQPHGDAFDLLQYAVRRREGFVVVTGDIGTGKTTLCRALLEQIDRTTFTALVLNPFLTEEDLLKRILLDFGVVSREELKQGRLAGVSKQELVDALYDFLLSLIPLKASAVLIIDEAQNLPLPVLEQIRILSNLETDKEKLLQIILVGQLNLRDVLASPELRQLDQRVSIRYELTPLDRETTGAYVAHRLAVAGGAASVVFAPKALDAVHRYTRGIPRLINLVCDRSLLAAYAARASRIGADVVDRAADSLDLGRRGVPAARPSSWRARMALLAPAAVVLLASMLAVGSATYTYERYTHRPAAVVGSSGQTPASPAARVGAAGGGADARRVVFVGSFPSADVGGLQALGDWLRAAGFAPASVEVDLGTRGRWQRVVAGTYTDLETAERDAARLNSAAPGLNARVLSAALVSDVDSAVSEER